ncbi:DEAD/DEAH box helicase [Halomonas denitrificans]|nr:DEAD/DEAH box helicase [Halomonas denitrificans]
MSEWALEGQILVLRRAGEDIVPTAEEVYSSIIEGRPPWPDTSPVKSGVAGSLKFSRYPVDVQVVVEDQSEGKMPLAVLSAQPQSGKAFRIAPDTLSIGHVVESGTWYPLSPSSVTTVSDLLREGDVNDQGVISSFRGLLNLKKAAASGEPVADHMLSDRHSPVRMLGADADSPTGIDAQLYTYQVDGWRWLSFILREELGALLADEMGLGKTLQVISALRDPGTGSKVSRSLIVAPGSLLENWKREINKFCPDLSVLKHQGSMRTGRPKDLEQFDVVVTSYETVVRDLSLLKMIDWSVVALDEAQNIKNPKAKRTLSVKQLPRSASLAITGTPIENRLTDLWSIMDFTLPGYLGSLKDFGETYDDDVDAAAAIEPLISPLMLRRRVAEVASDLPERIDIPEIIELSEAEAQEYDRIRQTILDEYGQSATLVSLTKLRQFCAHPSLLPDHETENLPEEFAKFARLLEIIEEITLCDEKAIIFTSYTQMADTISAEVRKRFGVFADTLDGRTPIDDRQSLIDRFSEELGSGVLVLNPKAGGAGLNITAATHVIHYNLEWNPALEDQASARAHRRGQTKPVMVRRLICEGTVEEIVEDRVQRKRRISEAAVVGVSGAEEEYADLMAALAQSPMSRADL